MEPRKIVKRNNRDREIGINEQLGIILTLMVGL